MLLALFHAPWHLGQGVANYAYHRRMCEGKRERDSSAACSFFLTYLRNQNSMGKRFVGWPVITT